MSESQALPDGDAADDGWLVEVSAPDDAGAQTQAAFHFQHECTARMCVPMLVREGVVAIVCEEHEDFVVFYESSAPELISVKHRGAARGAWSFATLLTDGGIGHLFERWLATGKRACCRLMTNGALKTGKGQARQFADGCHSRDAALIQPWAAKLAEALKVNEVDAASFAAVLSIESDLPGKEYLGTINVTELVAPALARLGLDRAMAQGCYDRTVAAVARANRDAAGDRVELLDVIADPSRLDLAATRDRRLRRRRLDRPLMASLLLPRSGSSYASLGAIGADAPPPSRLQQKLEAGGLGPTVLDAAVRLRAAWYGFERARRTNVPGGDPAFDDLRLRVQELVGLSESRVSRDGEYGAAMHLDVRTNVTTAALETPAPFPMDNQLLQGLVFQLTDECKVWWSAPFELRSA